MSDSDTDLLRRLLDIETIKRLEACCFRTLDHQDWDGFGRVFAVDGVLEVPEANLVARGRDAIVAAVPVVHRAHEARPAARRPAEVKPLRPRRGAGQRDGAANWLWCPAHSSSRSTWRRSLPVGSRGSSSRRISRRGRW